MLRRGRGITRQSLEPITRRPVSRSPGGALAAQGATIPALITILSWYQVCSASLWFRFPMGLRGPHGEGSPARKPVGWCRDTTLSPCLSSPLCPPPTALTAHGRALVPVPHQLGGSSRLRPLPEPSPETFFPIARLPETTPSSWEVDQEGRRQSQCQDLAPDRIPPASQLCIFGQES